jgi:hypothetical protein
MKALFTGGCACGAIRYEISGEPIAINDRHSCEEGGAGPRSHLSFPRGAVKVAGGARHWDGTGDNSGRRKTHASCPFCGAPVYMTLEAAPDIFVIRAASLDDPRRYKAEDLLSSDYAVVPTRPRSAQPTGSCPS